MSGQSDQYADLAARTDQNRIEFLRSDLELCFTLTRLAETEYGLGNEEHADRSHSHAEEGYATLHRFVADPRHAEHIPPEIRRELTEGLDRLRAKVDGIANSRAGRHDQLV